MRKDVATIVKSVTDKIIKDMEGANPSEWMKGWTNTSFQNLNGHHYTGFNVFWLSMIDGGFLGGKKKDRKIYGTFLQWKAKGLSIKKGSKAIPLLKPIIGQGTKEVETPEGKKDVTYNYKYFKTFNVFNIEDVDGDVSSWDGVDRFNAISDVKASQVAEDYVSNLKAKINHIDGGNAYYVPSQDAVFLPSKKSFIDTKDSSATHNYYTTLFHELTHWTGSKSRCNRDLTGWKGSASYAFEELVAELGSAFLANQLDICVTPRADHAKYLKGWAQCLKDKPQALLNASGLANKALAYMNSKQPKANAKVVLNTKADPVTSIKEYKIDANGKRELIQVVA